MSILKRKKLKKTTLIKNIIIKFFLLLLSLPFLILIIILYPFKKIKINELETRSIGHFSVTTEIFLSELEKKLHNEKNTLFLWFTNSIVANNFLLSKWKEKFIIGPRIILKPILGMILKYKCLKFLKSPFRHWLDIKNQKNWQMVDIYKVLPITKPHIVFNKKEKIICSNYLKKFNIKNYNYICFEARTYHYSDDFIQTRDSNIEIQLPGIAKLCIKKKLKAIRVGSKAVKLKKSNRLIIDYANSRYKNEMLDIYLPMHCKFMITTGTGLANVPHLNRRKVLIVNKFDLHAINMNTESYIPLMLPKKIKKISNNKILNFSTIFKLKLTEIAYEEDLNKLGYVSVPNTNEEINAAIFEMNNLIDKNKNKIDDSYLQNKFWKILYKFYRFKKPSTIRISNNFLNMNKYLVI